MIYVPRNLVITYAILLACVLGMGVYVLNLNQKEKRITAATEQQLLTPPVRGKLEAAELFIAYDDEGVVRREDAQIALPEDPAERTQAVVRALLKRYNDHPSPHPLAAGADVTDVYIVGRDLAVLDLNTEFVNGHRSGILFESLSVATIIETVSANVPQITRVRFLINGKEQSTLAGHADLLATYHTNEVHELVKTISY